MSGLLGGVRVLDLANQEGLLCGPMLANSAVDMVKVERLGGDDALTGKRFLSNRSEELRPLFSFLP